MGSGRPGPLRHTLSWGRRTLYWQGDDVDAAYVLHAHFRHESWRAASIINLQKAIRPMLNADRNRYLDTLAASASNALHKNNTRQALTVVRMLSGRSSKPCQNIRRPDGILAETMQAVKGAWQDHNASVFQGAIASRSALRQPTPPPHATSCEFDVGPVATGKAYRKLGRNKGVGYGGGAALAC